jgi:hypothetical protein
VKSQLYIVTHTGFYPALAATPPTENVEALVQLSEIIKTLRSEFGKLYVTAIVSVGEDNWVNDSALSSLRDIQRSLP